MLKLLFIDFTMSGLYRALCWMFLHSLWQGLILALLTGLVLSLTTRCRPQWRYNVLLGSLLFFLMACAGTFFIILNNGASISSVSAAEPLSAAVPELLDAAQQQSQPVVSSESYFHLIAAYFNKHAALIVTIWFVFFSARLIRMLSGLLYIQRLRHRGIQPAPTYWKQRLETLAQSLQTGRSVQLLESALTKVPVVIGWLKPLMLVPAGFFTQLNPDQVEAVLLHELAHIRRRDYLVNLVQSFVETIFFFNPAVLWVSSLIREDREACCDELAIAVTNDKPTYVEALVSFQEYTIRQSYMPAFAGKKTQLVNRAKRILYDTNISLSNAEKIAMSLCFAILVFFGLVFAKESELSGYANKGAKPKLMLDLEKNNAKPQENSFPETTVLNRQTTTQPEIASGSLVKGSGTSGSGDTLNAVYIDTIPLREDQSRRRKDLKMGDRLKASLSPLNSGPKPLENLESHDHSGASPSGDSITRAIIRDLIAENIVQESVIKNRENFSYRLDNDALLVNGIKQAEAVFLKFKSKYITKPEGHTTHSYVWKNTMNKYLKDQGKPAAEPLPLFIQKADELDGLNPKIELNDTELRLKQTKLLH
jgi:beta-lactamase regulating signal transducer with metallopeptidase domain